jgi:hypothetical protein
MYFSILHTLMAKCCISPYLSLFSPFLYVWLYLDPQKAKQYTSTKKSPSILFYKCSSCRTHKQIDLCWIYHMQISIQRYCLTNLYCLLLIYHKASCRADIKVNLSLSLIKLCPTKIEYQNLHFSTRWSWVITSCTGCFYNTHSIDD